MKKKVIGIPGWSTGELSFGVSKTYLDYISKFGIPHIIMPNEQNINCDVLLLPGGPDVLPSAYGANVNYYTGSPCPFRQAFYEKKLTKYIEQGIPVFGICLGMQMLNTYFEGCLTQHLWNHEQSSKRYETAHEIQVISNPFYVHANPKKKYEVNSHHHQAVTMSQMASDLAPMALAMNWDNTEDSIVEAFYHKSLPIAGLQWHPKFFGTY